MENSVLLTENSGSLLAALQELLTGAGHSVVACRSFEEARDYLHEHAPDAIVSGVRLGAFNGLHLLLLAKERAPGVVAIIYSGCEDSAMRTEIVGWGAEFVDRERLAEDLLPVLNARLGTAKHTSDVHARTPHAPDGGPACSRP
jgi:DNA-binding NtrC family response regulator